MVQLCRARVSQGEFRVHDLGDPISWLADDSVDLALCALAIEYVDDRVAALSELRRVLRPRRRAGAVPAAPDRGLAAPRGQLLRRPDHPGDLEPGLDGTVLAGAVSAQLTGRRVPYWPGTLPTPAGRPVKCPSGIRLPPAGSPLSRISSLSGRSSGHCGPLRQARRQPRRLLP